MKKARIALVIAGFAALMLGTVPTVAMATHHEKQNPCNPCGAKANPCGEKANPCKANPCTAKANPCSEKANPCSANPCKK